MSDEKRPFEPRQHSRCARCFNLEPFCLCELDAVREANLHTYLAAHSSTPAIEEATRVREMSLSEWLTEQAGIDVQVLGSGPLRLNPINPREAKFRPLEPPEEPE